MAIRELGKKMKSECYWLWLGVFGHVNENRFVNGNSDLETTTSGFTRLVNDYSKYTHLIFSLSPCRVYPAYWSSPSECTIYKVKFKC